MNEDYFARRLVFLKILGGGNEIGAQCIFLKTDKTNIVIDCGVRLHKKLKPLPDLDYLNDKRVDYLFITHGHLDHFGAAPVLAARHPEMKIKMTHPTAVIAGILLEDSLKIAEADKKDLFFNREDLGNFMNRIEFAEFGEWFSIGQNTEICFWPAGHIRGAASILVKRRRGSKESRLMVTGDISFTDFPTIEGAKSLPKEFDWTNTLITEATNGALVLPDRRSEERRLIEAVRQVLARGGQTLIPVFAVGRAQDVALALAEAGLNLWMGGMAEQVLASSAYSEDFYHPNINFMSSLVGDCVNLIANAEKQIVVTTSGMMEAGESKRFAHRWIDDPKNAIFIPGYQAEETLGHRILNVKPAQRVHFKNLKPAYKKAHAEIVQFYLSAHTDGPTLANWISNLHPERVLVIHSEWRGYQGLYQELKSVRKFPNYVARANNNKEFYFRY